MKVTCTANGNRVEVDADANTTLATLKKHIQDQTGIPPKYQNVCNFFMGIHKTCPKTIWFLEEWSNGRQEERKEKKKGKKKKKEERR